MGCPILLGYAEKANEVSKTWTGMSDDPQPDMIGEALSIRAPFRDVLEVRAKAALRIIVFDMLKRAIHNSKMSQDIEWLEDIPMNLEYEATSLALALQKIKERALAWRMHTDLLQDGKAKTEGEHIMLHVKRVWHVATIAESLAHDMAGESFVTAGTALAVVMAEVKVEAPEWISIFGMLKEAK